MSNLTKIIKEHLYEKVQNNELQNDDLVEIIDLLGSFLNLETISYYSKRVNLDYSSIKARVKSGKLKPYELFKIKFIIDND